MPRKKISKNSYSLLTDMTVDEDVYTAKNNLYAWYQLDSDPTATVIDKSGNSRSLTPGLSPSLSSDIIEHKTSGFPKSSFSFNSNDLTRVDFGNSFTFNEPGFSGAAWIKIPGYSTNHFIMSKFKDPTDPSGTDWEWIFQIPGSGKLNLSLYQNAVASRSTSSVQDVPVNKWLHVGFVYNGSTGETSLYINGKNISVTTNNSGTFGQVQDTNAKFVVGWNDGQYSSYDVIGNIAEVALWNEKLTDSDFAVLYKIIAPSMISGFVNLPPRIEIRNRDNATGSYPTTLRMGDKDRRGSYSTQFDDTNTIFFGRRINDNFELTDKIKVGGVMNYSKTINSKLWTHSTDMEIRRETFVNVGGGTALDGALVFTGPGDGDGRWIQTREKIKNPILEMDVIQGPYNQSRTALGAGLGLENPGISVLKVQASLDGSSWEDIKEIPNNAEGLFLISAFSSRIQFEELLRKRKRVSIKISIQEFSIMKGDAFYLRIIEEAASISDPSIASWAIGKINIDYHNEEVNYPLMIDAASRVGQRVASGAIATPHTLPTLTAPGRSISGISDFHLKFTPGEDISAFDDSRILTIAESQFFTQGTDPGLISGMSSPLWSKTQFVIDLSPQEETTFGMNTPSVTAATSSLETDDKIKQQLMVYWNKDIKRWEKIAQGVSGNPANSSLENMISSGALGFSGIDMVSTGSSDNYADQNILSPNVLNSYARPTSTFGFPFEGKYHATSSQYIKASDLGITKPFILEKCQISFNAKFEFGQEIGDAEDAYSLLYGYGGGSVRTVDSLQRIYIPTFFILRQQDYDNFTTKIEYNTDDNGILNKNNRYVTIPQTDVRLSTSNTEYSSVQSSRELLTYGQITLFTSSSIGNKKFNIREALDNGLSRDSEINILLANGQNGQLASNEDVNPITGSFIINFPSRVTGKIDGGSRFRAKDGSGSGNLIGVWLDNKIGGRSYDSLDTSSRAIINGNTALEKAGSYKTFSTDTGVDSLDISVANADSTDLFSPYVIMPEDNIVFGWQYPMTNMLYDRSPGTAAIKFHSMTLFSNANLTLFGSQLQDGIEFHETNNQNLGSDAVHEIIGSEPVVDQFELSRAIENFGNYLDNYVATSVEEPVDRVLSLVQSRLTTPKGQGGAASATIQFPLKYVFPTPNNPGPNDGDRIAIRDGLGNVGHFYGFRTRTDGPLRVGPTAPLSEDTNDDGSTDNNLGAAAVWVGSHFEITRSGISYSGWPASNDYPTAGDTYSSEESPEAGNTPDFIYAFRIVGGDHTGTSYTHSEMTQTMNNLISAINASGLRLSCTLYSDPFASYNSITLTLFDSGTAAQNAAGLAKTDAKTLYSDLQDDYTSFNITGFSGASDLLNSSLGSFARITPTRDAERVYVDSLLKNENVGYSNSSFGTMQTDGSPIRPKYYLSSRKFGQAVDFVEQGRDSKTRQDLAVKRSGLIDSRKGGALKEPVSVTFVSGSDENSTGIRSFKRISPDTAADSVNKTLNSALTGAFYDPA